ncbi:hypothetical protein [Candidatus Electronema sp. PJ]|uniref:hypothetical protein n=1 Tax=Candidatus Electronema sp. PJ TaxID=3401572 RepID=UPI003AA98FCB
MVPSIKLVLLAALVTFVVIAGNAGAQTETAAEATTTEVHKTLEKAGVKDAEKIEYLPKPAMAIFKAVNQGQDVEAIQKAYDEAAKQIPRGGSNP